MERPYQNIWRRSPPPLGYYGQNKQNFEIMRILGLEFSRWGGFFRNSDTSDTSVDVVRIGKKTKFTMYGRYIEKCH